jgi:hypothetical protein
VSVPQTDINVLGQSKLQRTAGMDVGEHLHIVGRNNSIVIFCDSAGTIHVWEQVKKAE